nr:hypothetical protein [Tanacetum cinerariifolium]
RCPALAAAPSLALGPPQSGDAESQRRAPTTQFCAAAAAVSRARPRPLCLTLGPGKLSKSQSQKQSHDTAGLWAGGAGQFYRAAIVATAHAAAGAAGHGGVGAHHGFHYAGH